MLLNYWDSTLPLSSHQLLFFHVLYYGWYGWLSNIILTACPGLTCCTAAPLVNDFLFLSHCHHQFIVLMLFTTGSSLWCHIECVFSEGAQNRKATKTTDLICSMLTDQRSWEKWLFMLLQKDVVNVGAFDCSWDAYSQSLKGLATYAA